MPIYPLYALLFADSGLSPEQISGLFALWSAVGMAAEVPAGAFADRVSRRSALVLAGMLQAAGHLAWIAWPHMAGFALGFVLWALGGAFGSGSLEALVHDGLAAVGEEHRYAGVMGRAAAAALVVQVPLAGAAGLIFALGGYPLLGATSAAVCLCAAALARTLPEAPRGAGAGERPPALAALRAGVREAVGSPAVRAPLLVASALAGLDALEEYFALLAGDWGVPTAAVPPALLGVPLAGAAGAALAGRATARPRAVLLPVGAGALALAVLAATPAGLAGVAAFYGTLRLAMVVADARLQAAIAGPARATVTSVASLGSEVVALAVFGAWAVGGAPLTAAVAAVVALAAAPVISGPRRPGACRGRGR